MRSRFLDRSPDRATFQSLRVRNYRLFATGQLISLIFGWVQITAQDWLVLQVSHNSPSALGVVTALQFTPMLLFTLYAGTLADRLDKRLLLMIVNAAWLVLASLMGLLVISGAVQLWQVYLFAALWGTVSAVETPVRQAFTSELVDAPLLPNALSLSSAAFNTARIVGPALAGVAIAALGTGSAFLVNAASYAFPLIALGRMRPADLYLSRLRPAAGETRVADGLRYVRRRPDLLLPLAVMFVIGLVGFNFQLTLAVLAKNVFHTGAATFGLLTTSLAAGALAGALSGTRRRTRPSARLVVGAATVFGVLETTSGLMPTYLLTAAVLVVTGFAMIYLAQAANQRVQLGTDPVMRGRVMALYTLAFLGTNPVGAPLVGWFAEAFGPRASIWAGGLISLAAAGVALAVTRANPRVSVNVVPAWHGDGYAERAPAELPERGLRPVAGGDRAGVERGRPAPSAQLSGVDA